MNDTPQYIKELQLKIWLTKTPGERLYQFLIDNDKMYQGILALKKGVNSKAGEMESHQNNEKLK